MHQALYRKWRPPHFDEVYGQDHITSILKYQCATGKFSHAYLFCGSRGTGKTTCAKILAKAVNCLNPTPAGPCGECAACRSIDSGAATDVLEMDAASNNGVDDIRDIRDEVIYTPSELKYRVYIIDEVHMLSASAFNALLKTLEEPPEHVVFILATTELQKLPATIISRCQRFDFRRISTDDLCARLHQIAREEEIDLFEEAARLIARQAQGGMRDAVSLLELCAGARLPITPELVTRTVGTTGREGTYRVVNAIANRDFDLLFAIVDEMVSASRDVAVFWQELIGYYRDMLVTKTVKEPSRYLDLTDSERDALVAVSARFTKEVLLFHIGLLEDALFAMQKSYAVKRTVCEITLVRLCDPALDTSSESILARLSRVEEQLVAGIPVASAAQPAAPPVTASAGEVPVTEPSPVTDEIPLPEMPLDLWEPPVDTYAADQTAPPPTKREVHTPKSSPANPAPAQAKVSTPRPTPAPDPAPPATAQRVLRPLRAWTEAVERVKATSRMAASFLMPAKAYTTVDGKVVVKLDSGFARDMVAREGAPEALRAALSVCLGHKLEATDILYEVEEEKKRDGSLIDLIIEAAEE
ncbi:MAG: DNA polymerase III subunit gamma/tau [Clostridia bacterium]|nr:DNA polymerase III subunit gamma/tau [Clostridia bacterium]